MAMLGVWRRRRRVRASCVALYLGEVTLRGLAHVLGDARVCNASSNSLQYLFPLIIQNDNGGGFNDNIFHFISYAFRYTYIDHASSIWNGTILIVVAGRAPPTLTIHPAVDEAPKAVALCEIDNGADEVVHGVGVENGAGGEGGEGGNGVATFWRFNIAVPLSESDQKVVYEVETAEGARPVVELEQTAFWVPAKGKSMRLLFQSCNGFSLGVEPGAYAGPVLWKEVLRREC